MLHAISRYLILAVGLAMAATAPAWAAKNPSTSSVTYSGQGLIADGFGGYDLTTELCGVANGAEVDGPYLLWIVTATKSTTATITGPWGTAAMTKFANGTFKYVSAWYPPNTLTGAVSATYDGGSKNAQLVVSHGCRPFNKLIGAWCSPGFWGHATDGAWALTGLNRNADLFNDWVYPEWYGASFGANPTLQTVLNNAPTYSGSPLPGTKGYPLNAFNATGAMLTNALDELGYEFSFDAMTLNNESQTCPIDHFGNLK